MAGSIDLLPVRFRHRILDWRRTYLMGVVNVTPDSFSDGGRFASVDDAVAYGRSLCADGADLLDVGGESTRPGAQAVDTAEELARVLPVIEQLSKSGDVIISIDTCKAEVARAALELGAEVVNDVSGGLADPALLVEVARAGAAVVVGHLRGTPWDMQSHARYSDVVGEVSAELSARVEAARAAGVGSDRIWIDPGLGFAKEAEHSLQLIGDLERLTRLGHPLVVGASRKSFLGQVTGLPVGERELATAAADTAAILKGASVVRVHDVRQQRGAVAVADALKQAGAAR
jgi:dihydropteroate synthase